MKSVVTVLKTIKCEIECHTVLQREKNGWRFKLIDSTAPAKKEDTEQPLFCSALLLLALPKEGYHK
jgi:hypothetical protein